MRTLFRLSSYLLILMFALISCRDEELDPYLKPQAGVHGYGELKSGAFAEDNIPGSAVNVDVRWVSVDGKVAIDKIELYVNFLEEYTDKDGNPAVAVHGGAAGKTASNLLLTGLANRTPGTVTISANQVYDLFKDARFKYDGATEVSVFNNPAKPRPTGQRFQTGDSFVLTWRLYSPDGKVYKSWSPSVCTELRGANCEVDWAVE